MLVVKDLNKAYGERKILQHITIEVEKGKTLAIIGPSGCGKSTLLKCIAGLVPYDTGSMTLNGQDITDCIQDIGFNFQEHNLFPWLTVYKNLSLGLVARKVPKNLIEEKIYQVANDLNISHLLFAYPYTLSGGEKQRVAIGRILAYTPSLLLLDEPSSALDALTKEKFQDTLVALKGQYPMTTLLVTHHIEEAVYLGDRIMVMNLQGTYTFYDVKLLKEPNIRKEIGFFEVCKSIRQLLEEGQEDEAIR